MGKAGKWILNFLVGKKEEKHSKKKKIIGSCFSNENLLGSRNESDSQNMKLRWSFGKRKGNLITHKASKSVDSIDTSKLALKLAIMAEGDAEKKKKKVSDAQRAAAAAAATKIQSAYRSHLARKALHALRGLVKLQALVRGHLVRKQTASALKSMQALMAIQVRARFHRIHTVENENKLSIHRRFVYDNHRIPHKGLDKNPDELRRPYKSKSGYISHSQIERIENEPKLCSSKRDLTIAKRRHQYENYSISQNHASQCYVSMSKQNAENNSFSNYSFNPNYMAKTESSKAKFRSQSEPKQRPRSSIRQKSKKIEMMDRTSFQVNDQRKNSLEIFEHNDYEDQNPWFMKLYQLTRTSINRNGDSVSTNFSHHDDQNI